MQKFDLIVIGAGSGLNVAAEALERGWKVAVIENGPMGGTCLNRGCIPSKMLIHHADVAQTIRDSQRFHIKSKIARIDFKKIVREVNSHVDEEAAGILAGWKNASNGKVFQATARFTGGRTLQAGSAIIQGKNIVIAAGCRPSIPPIPGLAGTPFLTSDDALRLEKQPKTMAILGGGYIAAELAHFFGALGTKVTIIQRNRLLVPDEDEEVAQAFTKEFSKRYAVHLEHVIEKVAYKNKAFTLSIAKKEGGGKKTIKADQLLIATGRIPNSDWLHVKEAGVEVNEHGFVKTNPFLETTAPNVWALGDIVGNYMFKHSANYEAEIVANNLFHAEHKRSVDYTAMPHAVFSNPPMAGVGKTEQELKAENTHYSKAVYPYAHTGMGGALKDSTGFVKVLAEPETGKVLGCHILGYEAPTLLHEVLVLMRNHPNPVQAMQNTIFIHPALSEVVQRAFYQV
ncbi:MAG: dihydrolipoyl dehydrogenase [Candidatus Diapherotrites archaeon]|nr:dihydrolipoyl dehydrogenase [Candidatus Diapherotrites archaeon]